MASEIKKNANTYCYGSSIIGTFPWGSNLTIANNGEYLLLRTHLLLNATPTIHRATQLMKWLSTGIHQLYICWRER